MQLFKCHLLCVKPFLNHRRGISHPDSWLAKPWVCPITELPKVCSNLSFYKLDPKEKGLMLVLLASPALDTQEVLNNYLFNHGKKEKKEKNSDSYFNSQPLDHESDWLYTLNIIKKKHRMTSKVGLTDQKLPPCNKWISRVRMTKNRCKKKKQKNKGLIG